jgi:hypothetical protein
MGGFRVVAFEAGSMSMPPLPGLCPVATAPIVGPTASTALGDD